MKALHLTLLTRTLLAVVLVAGTTGASGAIADYLQSDPQPSSRPSVAPAATSSASGRYSLDRYLIKQPAKPVAATAGSVTSIPAAIPVQAGWAVSGGVFAPAGFQWPEAAKGPTNAWQYWASRNAAAAYSLTNWPSATEAENDCEYCKDSPRPRKCCGHCGRVNDCELCAMGVHDLPGGTIRSQTPGASSVSWNLKDNNNNTCPACRNLVPPRNCCGKCGRPHECQHCASGEHLPGGMAIGSRPSYLRNAGLSDNQMAATYAYGDRTRMDGTNSCSACKNLVPPRNCCGKCGRAHECIHCATGAHLPGGYAIGSKPAYQGGYGPGERNTWNADGTKSTRTGGYGYGGLNQGNEGNNCPACRNLTPPRNCCGKCGRAHECIHCSTGAHLPGGYPIGTKPNYPNAAGNRTATDAIKTAFPTRVWNVDTNAFLRDPAFRPR